MRAVEAARRSESWKTFIRHQTGMHHLLAKDAESLIFVCRDTVLFICEEERRDTVAAGRRVPRHGDPEVGARGVQVGRQRHGNLLTRHIERAGDLRLSCKSDPVSVTVHDHPRRQRYRYRRQAAWYEN
jgi:hypothetical protein